jgi:hypothetical protein
MSTESESPPGKKTHDAEKDHDERREVDLANNVQAKYVSHPLTFPTLLMSATLEYRILSMGSREKHS